MKEQIIDKEKKQTYMQEHTLTDRDLRKLIREKFARARAYQDALRKREELLAKSQ